MAAHRAERTVVWTMRLLAAAFAITGVLFLAEPDGILGALEDVGAELGDFAAAPETDQRVWLALGFAYMVVITGLALLVQADVARFRPLLLLLAAGKAASSLAAGAFFLFDQDAFPYLVNFAVDGALVAVALWCWALAGRAAASGPSTGGSPGRAAVERPAEAAGRHSAPAS